jgi:glycosyltransferase involved in cell wall biosynthesis
MKMPKITIVTPSYNQGRYLEQTILSVLGQHYPELEYIVMDGGSTDNSVEIIKRYADKLAYWQSKPDRGQSAAIANGFARATGEILGWVNSDDMLLPNSLEHVARYFVENPNCHFLVGDSIWIDSQGHCIARFYASAPSFRSIKYYRTAFNQPAAFWRSSAFEAVGRIDVTLQFCLDRDLFIRLTKLGRSNHISKFLAAYRWHALSKTSMWKDVQQREDAILRERYQLDDKTFFSRHLGYCWYRFLRIPQKLKQVLNSDFALTEISYSSYQQQKANHDVDQVP